MLNLFKSQGILYTLLLCSKELYCRSILHHQHGETCTLNLQVTSGSNLSMPTINFTHDILFPNFIYIIFKGQNCPEEQYCTASSVSNRFLQYCHILLIALSESQLQSVNEKKIEDTLLLQKFNAVLIIVANSLIANNNFKFKWLGWQKSNARVFVIEILSYKYNGTLYYKRSISYACFLCSQLLIRVPSIQLNTVDLDFKYLWKPLLILLNMQHPSKCAVRPGQVGLPVCRSGYIAML